jgi:hypothetical protein
MLDPRKYPVPMVQPTPIKDNCHHFKSPLLELLLLELPGVQPLM